MHVHGAHDHAVEHEGHERGTQDNALHPHHPLSISMTLLQIAIALASIRVRTQKRWLLAGAALSAMTGAVLGIIAWA